MEMHKDDPKLIAWYEEHKNSDDIKDLSRLIGIMRKNRWYIHSIDDGEDLYKFPSPLFAKMIASNLDDYRISFYQGTHLHTVAMINGQHPDTISDYSFSSGDPDGFDAIMKSIDL